MRSSQELSPLTFGNEDRLPRVPLPTLEESCDRFLEWCGPVLTADERAAINRSKAAAARDEFATDEQVRAVWAKHGL